MSPFHEDEIAAQRLAGFAPSGAGIRDFMPDQHRAFFAGLSYLFVGLAGEKDWPVATTLTGEPGFVAAPEARILRVAAAPAADDPGYLGWRAGGAIGLLGIDFATRRRNRANGVIIEVERQAAKIAVAQSFGNCAKYIQRRMAEPIRSAALPMETLAGLDEAARALLRRADTAFIASRSREGLGPEGGFDVSHRGGPPGFIADEGEELVMPEYPGNRYMNTFGNLLGDPRVGLLALDFDSGDALQLQVRAEIDWTADRSRRLRFHIERGWRRRAALPFAWTFVDYAPSTMSAATQDRFVA